MEQRDIPCCVSCALATVMEILNPSFPALAPLFHYYITRSRTQGTSQPALAGLDLPDAFHTLAIDGICDQRLHPHRYDVPGSAARPVPAAVSDAALRNLPFDIILGISRFYLLSDANRESEWKVALQKNHPILAGKGICAQYASLLNQVRQTGSAPFRKLDNPGPIQTGDGHAVAVIGYNDHEQSFLVQDSRGRSFGIGGQWWLPYTVAETRLVKVAYAFRT